MELKAAEYEYKQEHFLCPLQSLVLSGAEDNI